jgi:hypothetical protein
MRSIASDGHCAAITGPAFTELGAGEAERYWTLVFARPLVRGPDTFGSSCT